MDNFFFGIVAVMRGGSFVLENILEYQLLWGFGLGFLVAALVHALLYGNSPRNFSDLLFKDKAIAFQKMAKAKRKKDGTYVGSYSEFKQTCSSVRVIFVMSVFIFLVIVLISIIKF